MNGDVKEFFLVEVCVNQLVTLFRPNENLGQMRSGHCLHGCGFRQGPRLSPCHPGITPKDSLCSGPISPCLSLFYWHCGRLLSAVCSIPMVGGRCCGLVVVPAPEARGPIKSHLLANCCCTCRSCAIKRGRPSVSSVSHLGFCKLRGSCFAFR